MNEYFFERMDDSQITVTNFYGMTPPDPQILKDRAKKVAKIIKDMGDTYRLAKSVKRIR